MRVQVHGKVEPIAEGRDEPLGGRGAEQARHVLDGDDVRAGVDDLVGEPQVVVEGVEVLGGVEQVARVAERHLCNGVAGREHRVDGRSHLRHVVQRVEDPEDVDTGRSGLAHEGVGDLRRIRGVADGVAPAEQHLDVHVGQGFAEGREALPRVFAEESEGDVVRRPAPRLDGEELGRHPGDVGCHRDEVLRAHARREQRLVRVAECRLGDRERSLLTKCGGEADGAELQQALARPGWRRGREIDRRQLLDRVHARGGLAVRLVDRDVGEPVQDLRAPVLRHASAHEPGALVDERRAEVAGDERRVLEHRLEE